MNTPVNFPIAKLLKEKGIVLNTKGIHFIHKNGEERIKLPIQEQSEETLEEAAERLYQQGLKDNLDLSFHDGVKFGTEWKSKRIEEIRDELYNQLPVGEVNAFDLIKIITNHIKKLDELI